MYTTDSLAAEIAVELAAVPRGLENYQGTIDAINRVLNRFGVSNRQRSREFYEPTEPLNITDGVESSEYVRRLRED